MDCNGCIKLEKEKRRLAKVYYKLECSINENYSKHADSTEYRQDLIKRFCKNCKKRRKNAVLQKGKRQVKRAV